MQEKVMSCYKSPLTLHVVAAHRPGKLYHHIGHLQPLRHRPRLVLLHPHHLQAGLWQVRARALASRPRQRLRQPMGLLVDCLCFCHLLIPYLDACLAGRCKIIIVPSLYFYFFSTSVSPASWPLLVCKFEDPKLWKRISKKRDDEIENTADASCSSDELRRCHSRLRIHPCYELLVLPRTHLLHRPPDKGTRRRWHDRP